MYSCPPLHRESTVSDRSETHVAALQRGLSALALLLCLAPAAQAAGPVGFGSCVASGVSDAMISVDFGVNGMNCKTVRTSIKAQIVMQDKNAPVWSTVDEQLKQINDADAGVEIVLCVTAGQTPPSWMTDTDDNGTPDVDMIDAEFGYFFKKVVERYSVPLSSTHRYGGVKYFEAFNEPNLQFTGTRVERANLYFDCLYQAWQQTTTLRSNNPAIKIIGGVMAGPPHSANPNDYDFFQQFWDVRGGWNYLHYFSYHNYIRSGDQGGNKYKAPEFLYGGPPTGINRGILWTDTLAWCADPIHINWHGKQVWVTECGYDCSSLGADSMGTTQDAAEFNQAWWIVRAAVTMRGSGFMDRFLQFSCYDELYSPEDYGFRDNAGAIQPQWWAWKNLCDVLDSTVTGISMKRYYNVNPADNTTDCAFRFDTNRADHKVYGWIVWWVPPGGSGDVTVGATIPADATVEKRTIAFTKLTEWQNGPAVQNGKVKITDVANTPMFIRITER